MRSLFAAAALVALGGAAGAAQPPPPPPQPVAETLYGVQVTDPYRYFEKLGPDTVAWMKAEGAYTSSLFASMPRHADILSRFATFTASFEPVEGFESYGGNTVYEQRTATSDNFDLFVRHVDGTTVKLVDVSALRAAHGGVPFAINYFEVSPDGAKVAVGISQGGSEDASITVFDLASGRAVAGPIDRARLGIISWTDDGSHLFLNQLVKLPPGAPEIEKLQNSRAEVWDLAGEPRPVLGSTVPGPIKVGPAMFPGVVTSPGSPFAAALVINGVQNEVEIWTAPLPAVLEGPTPPWTRLTTRDDGVTSLEAKGDDIFLVSHQDAPTFKVLHLKAGQPLSTAQTIVPGDPGRLIQSVLAAADALYVQTRQGVYSRLLRIPYGGALSEVALPVKGSISSVFTDPRKPGAVLLLEGWTTPPTSFAYDPATGAFADLKLGGRPPYDSANLEVLDLKARAKDGVEVPLSVIAPRDITKPNVVLLWAYGSYGISEFPVFSPRANFFVNQGAIYATCHVRGGGELGEAWRLAGKDANKPNTWRDLIACGEDLVARGYTTPDKLFIVGGSAGGITMGRALEERPDLFAGVIDAVPAANTIRSEFSPNGPDNIPEFGSVTTPEGFKNLYAMDSYMHVDSGVDYPAVLITTGLNDPRVAPWEPAKLAARLLATDPKRPVLLRVDEEAGHGIGSTKAQTDRLWADVFSFIFWRARWPGFTPGEQAGPPPR
jgi:prolyl oligopeptidase